ncbi:hypothetical protein QCL65_19665 [Pseudomonas sp. nanlin1]
MLFIFTGNIAVAEGAGIEFEVAAVRRNYGAVKLGMVFGADV